MGCAMTSSAVARRVSLPLMVSTTHGEWAIRKSPYLTCDRTILVCWDTRDTRTLGVFIYIYILYTYIIRKYVFSIHMCV